ncbi:hypothetical protein TraAM80_08648 [Trypanosoma rangeli]|uniref:Uncharacterized protein n=1 Tax=Trypanosoma rangeli TaxID=5698 RepID=A0A3R7KE29_TRYRA|nr:uncharacterized protein TraAM80_08648 [Trypanosoma rangeli]RNE98657.1 hypothetical protein TraAM80_08648 [Trypanosoma rangeli]|eukprot:RNE98657.1 hypothetical protein TraAM80_08648 [Trypanosoma rangeli]
MAGPSLSEGCIASVELICAEHLQRTLLACDEATAFQRIVAQAVVLQGGRWGFEQHYALGGGGHRGYPLDYAIAQPGVWKSLKGAVRADRVLERRERFMQKEGGLLHRIAVASRGIRESGASLYPSS